MASISRRRDGSRAMGADASNLRDIRDISGRAHDCQMDHLCPKPDAQTDERDAYGPVTIINWSFVRDDAPKSLIARQIALSLSDEIDDLQKRGIKIIQVDERPSRRAIPSERRISRNTSHGRWRVSA